MKGVEVFIMKRNKLVFRPGTYDKILCCDCAPRKEGWIGWLVASVKLSVYKAGRRDPLLLIIS
jgi:hypothetical protein